MAPRSGPSKSPFLCGSTLDWQGDDFANRALTRCRGGRGDVHVNDVLRSIDTAGVCMEEHNLGRLGRGTLADQGLTMVRRLCVAASGRIRNVLRVVSARAEVDPRCPTESHKSNSVGQRTEGILTPLPNRMQTQRFDCEHACIQIVEASANASVRTLCSSAGKGAAFGPKRSWRLGRSSCWPWLPRRSGSALLGGVLAAPAAARRSAGRQMLRFELWCTH